MTKFWKSGGAAIPAKKVNCSEGRQLRAGKGETEGWRTPISPDPAHGDGESDDRCTHRVDLHD